MERPFDDSGYLFSLDWQLISRAFFHAEQQSGKEILQPGYLLLVLWLEIAGKLGYFLAIHVVNCIEIYCIGADDLHN